LPACSRTTGAGDMVSVDQRGLFIQRPEIGTTYRSPAGDKLTVAAIWESGVVFEGGKITARATELARHFTPCTEAMPCTF